MGVLGLGSEVRQRQGTCGRMRPFCGGKGGESSGVDGAGGAMKAQTQSRRAPPAQSKQIVACTLPLPCVSLTLKSRATRVRQGSHARTTPGVLGC